MTVLELIGYALQDIGELSPGQAPNPEEAAVGLALLNNILQSWENARRRVFIIDNLQFPLEDGVGVYTVGPGGDFDTYRFVKIQHANIIFSDTGDPKDGIAHPLELINSKSYAQIKEKGMAAIRPLKLYNDNDAPLLKLYLWPVPTNPA